MGSFLGVSNTGLIVGVLLVIAIPMIIGRIRETVAWAYQRKMEATKTETLAESDISARLERLERAVRIIAGEMQRLSEAQRSVAELPPASRAGALAQETQIR